MEDKKIIKHVSCKKRICERKDWRLGGVEDTFFLKNIYVKKKLIAFFFYMFFYNAVKMCENILRITSRFWKSAFEMIAKNYLPSTFLQLYFPPLFSHIFQNKTKIMLKKSLSIKLF